MASTYSKYDLSKIKEVLNRDKVFQEVVVKQYLEQRWAELSYTPEEKTESYENLVIFLLENRETISDTTIEDIIYSDQTIRITMMAALPPEGRDTSEFDFIPQKVFRQILYSFKYSTIKTFFSDNWDRFVPDFDVINIKKSEQLEIFQQSFMTEFDRLADAIDEIYNVVDVDKVPDKYLNYLAQAIGYEREDENFLYNASFRELIKNIIEIYKIKGTNFSFELFFNFLGFEVQVNEFWFDKRFSDPNLSINEYTSVSDRNNFGFYLTTIKPTEYIPSGMRNPVAVTEEEIIGTQDGNEFNRILGTTDLTPEQILGIEPGYSGTPYTYFKTNIMQFTLERITDNVTQGDEEAAAGEEGEEDEAVGGLSSEDIEIIRLYANFLTPIFITRNIVVVTAPIESAAQEYLTLSDNPRTEQRALDANVGWNPQQTFLHLYAGLAPTEFYWEDGVRFYRDSYNVYDWDVNYSYYEVGHLVRIDNDTQDYFMFKCKVPHEPLTLGRSIYDVNQISKWFVENEFSQDISTIPVWNSSSTYVVNDLVKVTDSYGVTTVYKCIEDHTPDNLPRSIFDISQRENWELVFLNPGVYNIGGYYLDTYHKIFDKENANSVYNQIYNDGLLEISGDFVSGSDKVEVSQADYGLINSRLEENAILRTEEIVGVVEKSIIKNIYIDGSSYIVVLSNEATSTETNTLKIKLDDNEIVKTISGYNSGINIEVTGDTTAGSDVISNVTNIEEVEENFIIKNIEVEKEFYFRFSYDSSTASSADVVTVIQERSDFHFDELKSGASVNEIAGVIPSGTTILGTVQSTPSKQIVIVETQIEKDDPDSVVTRAIEIYSIDVILSNDVTASSYNGTLEITNGKEVQDLNIVSVDKMVNTITVDKNIFATDTGLTFDVYGDLFLKYGIPSRDLIYSLYDKQGDFAQPDKQSVISQFFGKGTPVRFDTDEVVYNSIDVEGYFTIDTDEFVITSSNYEKIVKDLQFRNKFIIPELNGVIKESVVHSLFVDDNVLTNNPNDDLRKIKLAKEVIGYNIVQGNNYFNVGETDFEKIKYEYDNFASVSVYEVDGVLTESVITNISFNSSTKEGTIELDNNILSNRDNLIIRISSHSSVTTDAIRTKLYYLESGRKRFWDWSSKFADNRDSGIIADKYNRLKIKEIIDDNGDGKSQIIAYDPSYRFVNFRSYNSVKRIAFNGDFENDSNTIQVKSFRRNLEFLNEQYFIIEASDSTFHYFWFNVSGEGVDPNVSILGVDPLDITGHEITISNNLMETDDIASLILSTIDTISGIEASISNSTLTINEGTVSSTNSGSFGANIIVVEENITIVNEDRKPFMENIKKGDKVILSNNGFTKSNGDTSNESQVLEVNILNNFIKTFDEVSFTNNDVTFFVVKKQFEDRLGGNFVKGSDTITGVNFSVEAAPEFIGASEGSAQYYTGDLVRSGDGSFENQVYICVEDFNSASVNTVTQATNAFKKVNVFSFIRPGMKIRLPKDLFEYEVVEIDAPNKSIKLDREYGITGQEITFGLYKEEFNFIEIENTSRPENDGVYNVEDIEMNLDSNDVNLATFTLSRQLPFAQAEENGFLFSYKPRRKLNERTPYLYNEVINQKRNAGYSTTSYEEMIGNKFYDKNEISFTGDFTSGSNEVVITSNVSNLELLNKNKFFVSVQGVIPKTNILYAAPVISKISLGNFLDSSELNENYIIIENPTDGKLYNFWFNISSGTEYTKPRVLPYLESDVVSVEISSTGFVSKSAALQALRSSISSTTGFNAIVINDEINVETDVLTDFYLIKKHGELIDIYKDRKNSIILEDNALATQTSVEFSVYTDSRTFTTDRPYLIYTTGIFDYSTNEIIITSNNFDEIMYAFDNYDSLKIVDNANLKSNEEQLFETVSDSLEIEASRKGDIFYYNDPRVETTDLIRREDINNSRFDIISYNRINTSAEEVNSITLDANANALGEYNFFIEVYDTEGVKPKSIDYYITGANSNDWPNNGKLEEVNIGGFSKTAMYELLNFFDGFTETEDRVVDVSYSNNIQRYNTFSEIAKQQFEISGIYNTDFDADVNTYETRHTSNFLGSNISDTEFYQEYLDMISIDYI